MAAIRYGARVPEQQRNREIEATTAKIWSTAVTVWWETDLDVIRTVLPPPLEPDSFYFKIRQSPDGKGFNTEPALVHCCRHEEAREGRAIDGTLELFESPLDPIIDIPVGRIVAMQFAQLATTQEAEVVERVP